MIPARLTARVLARIAATAVPAALALSALVTLAQSPPQDPATLDAGRSLSAQFERGDTHAVWLRMTMPMRNALGDEAGLAAFQRRVVESAGGERALLDESTAVDGDLRVYRRTAQRAGGGTFVTTWTLAAGDVVAGFTVAPATGPAPSAFAAYVTRSTLRLPFDGSWYVFWGGRALADNHHAVARDQRYAYDFVARSGKVTHRGNGTRNDDYYVWDRPIVAPAAGVVVRAVDGIDDNHPGVMNPRQPFGNHVVIDLGNGEFAVLAHLRRGTVSVRDGMRVAAGRAIGRCGNSGNSSEPHLHFHLQNSPREGDADGLPAQFQHYVADGNEVARGEPLRGQTVRAHWRRP